MSNEVTIDGRPVLLAAVLQPGDTLVVGISSQLSMEEFEHLRAQIEE